MLELFVHLLLTQTTVLTDHSSLWLPGRSGRLRTVNPRITIVFLNEWKRTIRNSREMLISPAKVMYTNLRSRMGMFKNYLCRLIRSRSDRSLLSTLKMEA